MVMHENMGTAPAKAVLNDNLPIFNNFTTILDNNPRDFREECYRHMADNQLPLVDALHLDGAVHRYSCDRKPHQRDEWYIGSEWEYNGRKYCSCVYGSWSASDRFIYKSWNEKCLTHDQCAALSDKLQQLHSVEENERKLRQNEAANEAKNTFDNAFEEPQSDAHTAYLKLKQIKAIGLRFGRNPKGYDSLIIPLQNIQGEIRSLQFISVSETDQTVYKTFLCGGQQKGCFCVLGELHEASIFFVCEGYATGVSVHQVSGLPVVVAFSSANIQVVIGKLIEKYQASQIIIAADDDIDNPKNPGRKAAEKACQVFGCRVIFPSFPDGWKLPNGDFGSDFNDILVHFGAEEAHAQLTPKTYFNPIDIDEFLRLEIPQKHPILLPWLREKDLVMIYAPTGIGKTWLALSIAYAIASGTDILKFRGCEPKRVLYVDGEMPSTSLQERLKKIAHAADGKIRNPRFLRFITHEFEQIKDLGTQEGQAHINELIYEFDVLILDNLSSLIRSGEENDASSWGPVQEWLLYLRKMGKTVIFVHHAGKKGLQRGTSKKEDVLDTVMVLRKANDQTASDGARFQISYEKNRGFEGDDANPFGAKLISTEEGGIYWECTDIQNERKSEAFALHEEGMNMSQIAKELGVHRSSISRWFKEGKN